MTGLAGMIQQGGPKGNKEGEKGGRGAEPLRAGGASKERMRRDGGGAVKGIRGELARSSVRELFNPSAFNPQPSPGMSVLFPHYSHQGASQLALLVKGPPANARRCTRHGFDPWVGKIPGLERFPGGGNGNLL